MRNCKCGKKYFAQSGRAWFGKFCQLGVKEENGKIVNGKTTSETPLLISINLKQTSPGSIVSNRNLTEGTYQY